jgi:hypothetical protein
MATDKTYSVVGTTVQPDGKLKIRWTNNVMRVKILMREGHTDIRLANLGKEMTKLEAVKAMQSLDEFQEAKYQSVIADYLDEHSTKTVAAAPAATQATETEAA